MVELPLLVRICFISVLRLLPLPCKYKECTSAMVVVSTIKQPLESQELLSFKNSEFKSYLELQNFIHMCQITFSVLSVF